MAGSFLSPIGEDLQQIYVDDYNLIDQYAATGSLWNWGHNSYGGLADNSITHKSSPVQTIAGGTNWKQIAAGFWFGSAIKTDGTLWLWGRNTYGQLGDNTRTHRSSPVQTVAGGTNWKLVVGGGYQAMAIKTNGTLWTWGRNLDGQLGDNTGGTGTHKSSPVQTIAGGTNWKLVTAGSYHVAAIKTDGTLWTWGNNVLGNLGDNTITHRSSPIQTVAGGTNWKQVVCKGFHISAIYFYDAGNLYPSA